MQTHELKLLGEGLVVVGIWMSGLSFTKAASTCNTHLRVHVTNTCAPTRNIHITYVHIHACIHRMICIHVCNMCAYTYNIGIIIIHMYICVCMYTHSYICTYMHTYIVFLSCCTLTLGASAA